MNAYVSAAEPRSLDQRTSLEQRIYDPIEHGVVVRLVRLDEDGILASGDGLLQGHVGYHTRCIQGAVQHMGPPARVGKYYYRPVP